MAWMDFKHIPAKQVMIAKVIEVLEEVEPNLWKVRVKHAWEEIIKIAGERPQEGEILELYPVPYEQWKEWTQGE